MSVVEEDAAEFPLAPQWLRGHSLHSPIGAASAKAGRQISTQQKPSSREPGLETPHTRGLPQDFSSSRSEERPSGFRSPARRSYASSRPYNSSNRSSRALLEDRYNTFSSPFSSSTTAAKQTSNNSSTSSNGTSALSWLNRHAGQAAQQSLRPSSTAAGSQVAPPQPGVHGARERRGLQRTVSEGSRAARGSSSRRVSRELALDPQGFPTLGSTSSSNSSRRSSSPEPYIPSVAPYKQEFLSSRSSLGWTSKLAAVPGGSSDDAESDSSAGRGPPAPAAGVEARNTSSRHSVGNGVELVHEQQVVADVAAPGAVDQLAIALPPPAAAVEPAVLSPQPSLAETLRHAAAAGATATADAPKRHSSALLQLLPAPKVVTKQGSSAPGRVSTAPPRDASRAKAAAANRPKPLGPPPTVPSQGVVNSQPTLVPLGHVSSSSNSSSSSGPSAGTAAVLHTDGVHTSSSNSAVPQTAQQSCKGAGVSVGSTAAAEQRQQVRDRHNFFAVLRRKTSSSSSGSSTVIPESLGTPEAGSVAFQGTTDSTSGAGQHTAVVAAAEPAVAADVAEHSEHGDIHSPEQQEHAVDPDSTSSRHVLDSHGISTAEHSQLENTAQADIGHCDQPQVTTPALPTTSIDTNGSSCSKTSSQLDDRTVDACSSEDQLSKHAKSVSATSALSLVEVASHTEPEIVAQDPQQFLLTEHGIQNDKQQQQQYRHPQSATWDLPSEEEEEAFLRSLGWTAGSSEDEQEWELTEEEIAAFQAAAAIRAAQQQHVAGHRQEQLPQRKLHGMHHGACTGNHNAFAGHRQQAHVVCAYGCDQLQGLYGIPVAGQHHSRLLLGVYMPPVMNILDRSSDSSDSSDDD